MIRRVIVVATLAAALTPTPAQAATLAECSRTTPVLSPQSNWPWRPIESCVVQFSKATAGPVTTKIDPADGFTGTVGLRVRGTNALWTEYEGTFVGGTLVSGVDTQNFNLGAGTWQLEVYLGGPRPPAPIPRGFYAVGTYQGSISTV